MKRFTVIFAAVSRLWPEPFHHVVGVSVEREGFADWPDLDAWTRDARRQLRVNLGYGDDPSFTIGEIVEIKEENVPSDDGIARLRRTMQTEGT